MLFFQPKGQRPPSPPRQLKDIYASDILAEEFKNYLLEIDAENENTTLQTFLNFVMKCDQIRQNPNNKKEVQKILTILSNDFFNCANRSQRLALKNEVTREELKKYLGIVDEI